MFRIEEYTQKYKELKDGETIVELSADEYGRRFDVVNITPMTEKEKYEIEIEDLKSWFNDTYTTHEQKYRRLNTLQKTCDDGTNPVEALRSLYLEAEEKRARIQELENLLKGE